MNNHSKKVNIKFLIEKLKEFKAGMYITSYDENIIKGVIKLLEKRNFKMIYTENYQNEPVQYLGYYILHAKELDLPKPEVFFVEEE